MLDQDAYRQQVLAGIQPAWIVELEADAVAAEQRRTLAKYDTGTVSPAAALYLRALTEQLRPKVAIEVGTFIGTSALAMRAGHVYTCDKSNDCGPVSPRITCHPFTGSKRMLVTLAMRGVKAEFFFFDGRIKDGDLPLILRLSTPTTVYAFDDYEGEEKGVLNVGVLRPLLQKHYELIEPPADVYGLPTRTTIALLVPRGGR